MSDDRMVNIACRVPPIVHQRIGEMAAKANMPLSTYAAILLQAAYAARVKPPSGDRDLDASVALVAVLWAEQRDTAQIAAALGLAEATVVRIIDGWRRCKRGAS